MSCPGNCAAYLEKHTANQTHFPFPVSIGERNLDHSPGPKEFGLVLRKILSLTKIISLSSKFLGKKIYQLFWKTFCYGLKLQRPLNSLSLLRQNIQPARRSIRPLRFTDFLLSSYIQTSWYFFVKPTLLKLVRGGINISVWRSEK